MDIACSSQHVSGVSQAMIVSMLRTWGWEGWEKHLKRIEEGYKKRRDAFISACEKHLTGLATWNKEITAGMFAWISIEGVEDSEKLINEGALSKKVILVPQKVFSPFSKGGPACRASFSLASEEQMGEAIRRLAELIKEYTK